VSEGEAREGEKAGVEKEEEMGGQLRSWSFKEGVEQRPNPI